MTLNIENYEFWNKLKNLGFVEAKYLFGSRATGTHRLKSDIDIALQRPNATPTEWEKVLEIIEGADTLLDVDCIRLDLLKTENPLFVQIMQTAKLIFDRTKI